VLTSVELTTEALARVDELNEIPDAATGRSGHYRLLGGGMGAQGFNVSIDPTSGWSDFETESGAGFADFDGAGGSHSSAGVALWFVDYEYDHLAIPSLVDGSSRWWRRGRCRARSGLHLHGRLAQLGR